MIRPQHGLIRQNQHQTLLNILGSETLWQQLVNGLVECFIDAKGKCPTMPLIMSLAEFGLSGAFSIDSELLVRLFDPLQEFVCSAFLKFPFDISASVSTLITRLCT